MSARNDNPLSGRRRVLCPARRPFPAVWLLLLAGGCAGRLPAYRWTDEDAALRDLRERELTLHTISSRCRISLDRADGARVHFDGALAARLPDAFRLRAWKLSQPVLDLTVLPDGIWLYAAVAEPGDRSPGEMFPAARLAQAWRLLTRGFTDCAWEFAPSSGRSDARLRMTPRPDDGKISCDLNYKTLTIRKCQVTDAEGIGRLTLRLDRYASVDGIVFPRHITAASAAGTITISLDHPAFNVELPERALTPPRRAVRQP